MKPVKEAVLLNPTSVGSSTPIGGGINAMKKTPVGQVIKKGIMAVKNASDRMSARMSEENLTEIDGVTNWLTKRRVAVAKSDLSAAKKNREWAKKNPKTAGASTAVGAALVGGAAYQAYKAFSHHAGTAVDTISSGLQNAGYEPEGESMINENIRCAIDRIAADANQDEARDMIQSALGEKILGLLDTKKAEIAKVYFSGVPEETTDGDQA